MLHKSIIDKIKAKYGRNEIYSADCELIADAINKGHSGSGKTEAIGVFFQN